MMPQMTITVTDVFDFPDKFITIKVTISILTPKQF